MSEAAPPVLFFDGECGLCNRTVRWLIARDPARVLHFAPLQSPLAAHKRVALPHDDSEWAIAFWDEDGIHYESDATLRAVARLRGPWRLAYLLLMVPRTIRNAVYRSIARNRIRWFGRVESCALLSAAERDRLLR